MELQQFTTQTRAEDVLRHLIFMEENKRPSSRFVEALRLALQVGEEVESELESEIGAAQMPPYRLRRAKSYIEANLCVNLRLDDIAATAGLSSFHFCRQFKRSTGKSPLRYVLERRIERAKVLVSETDRPLVDISLELGFSSQSHFTAMFRKLTGVTPRRYRELFYAEHHTAGADRAASPNISISTTHPAIDSKIQN